MKIIFMGTPDFAVPVLDALSNSRHTVEAVFTKPDEEQGRGKKIVFSPVKTYALSHGIPVFQPETLKKKELIETLRSIEAEVIVVAAYGKILRKTVLTMKRFGCINVHASLLPAYRGAAPIQWAVLNGEKTSGVTIMQMDEGLDTGDILAVKEITLDEKETSGSLFEKLSKLGGPLLLDVLDEAENGTLHPVKQPETTTPYAKMLEKQMGLLDFSRPAIELERWIRGMDPWPSAYTFCNGKLMKIYGADVVESSEEALPGTVIDVSASSFTVQCGEGALRVTELQPEGKKRMATEAYLRGNKIETGTVLGPKEV